MNLINLRCFITPCRNKMIIDKREKKFPFVNRTGRQLGIINLSFYVVYSISPQLLQSLHASLHLHRTFFCLYFCNYSFLLLTSTSLYSSFKIKFYEAKGFDLIWLLIYSSSRMSHEAKKNVTYIWDIINIKILGILHYYVHFLNLLYIEWMS